MTIVLRINKLYLRTIAFLRQHSNYTNDTVLYGVPLNAKKVNIQLPERQASYLAETNAACL